MVNNVLCFVCLPFRRWKSSFKISLHCKRCRVRMHSHYSKCCWTMCATYWNSVKRCSTHWRATMKIATQSNSTHSEHLSNLFDFHPRSPSPHSFPDEFNWFHYSNLLSVCLFYLFSFFLCVYFPIKTECTCEMWLKLLTFSLNWWNDSVMAVLLFKINRNRARKIIVQPKNHQNEMHKPTTLNV